MFASRHTIEPNKTAIFSGICQHSFILITVLLKMTHFYWIHNTQTSVNSITTLFKVNLLLRLALDSNNDYTLIYDIIQILYCQTNKSFYNLMEARQIQVKRFVVIKYSIQLKQNTHNVCQWCLLLEVYIICSYFQLTIAIFTNVINGFCIRRWYK